MDLSFRPFTISDYDAVTGLWRRAGIKLTLSDTMPEIARMLRLSEKTVYGRLNKAKLTLKSALNPQHGSDHIGPSQRR